jgi:hypothetical protein
VISRADACNQEAQNDFNVPGNGGGPPTPEPEGCAGAAFDARLIDPLTNSMTFPAGSEVCLNNQGENQGVNILDASGEIIGTVNVVATPSGPDQQCNTPQQSRAEIDSGTVPRQGPFEFGDTICLNLQTQGG